MNEKTQGQGLEITIPKFLFNRLVWIVMVITLFGVYQLVNLSQQRAGDQTFKAMCEKDFGKDAWMSMKPIKDGKEVSNTPCWGCMVDDNSMICDRNEYETLQSKKNTSSQSQSLGYFKKVSSSPVTIESKPYFLFIGAQYCPFCAAERWSIVRALSHFGTWSNLGPDKSADEEAGSVRIPTYNFVGINYQSQYITFAHKEVADRDGKPIPDEELTELEKKWNNAYNPQGGVPFLFINGQYVQQSSGFSPSLLSGKTYDEVKDNIDKNSNTPYVQAINKEADIITAYLCKATENRPSEVCSKPEIASLVTQVP